MLLKKANTITTPTAYSNGFLHSVKPEVVLGEELVTNGDFSQSGTATTSSYSLGWYSQDLNDVVISSGVMTIYNVSGGGGRAYATDGSSSKNIITSGKKYRLTYTVIENNGVSSFLYHSGGAYVSAPLTLGTHTIDYTSGGSIFLFKNNSTGTNIVLDNVSLKEDISADFTFTRNSSATRVNELGYIEDVQIIGGELVSNGDFEEIGSELVTNGDFEQIGSELVTNGSFDTDTAWVKQAGWTISGGTANFVEAGGNRNIYQSILTLGKFYQLTFTISNYVSGSIRNISNPSYTEYSADGTYTEIFSPTTYTNLFLNCGFGSELSIDNVSVKEVGQDWVDNDGAVEFSLGQVRINSGVNGTLNRLSQASFTTVGRQYRLSYEVLQNVGTTNFALWNGSTFLNIPNSVGINTFDYTQAASGSFILNNRDAASGKYIDITNISVKEVGQDWTFNTSGNNQWSLAEGQKASYAGTATDFIITSNILTIGRKYRVSFDILDTGGSTIRLSVNSMAGGSFQDYTLGDGRYTEDLIAGTNYIRIGGASSGATFSIDNISVKEVTDDTDLPRINYDGFTYAESLGDNLVVNGTFDTDSNWSKTNAVISGGVATITSTGYAYAAIVQNNVLTIGKRYKATIDIKSITGGIIIGASDTITSGGIISEYFTATQTYLEVRRDSAYATTIATIDNVSVQEVIGDLPVPYSGKGHLLLEPQRTNLFTYSEDFSQWTAERSSAALESLIAPDGSGSVYSLIDTTDNNTHYAQLITNAVSANWTASCFVKKRDDDIYIQLRPAGIGSGKAYATFNPDDGSLTDSGGTNLVSTFSEDYGNGWYRVGMTCSAPLLSADGVVIILSNSSTGELPVYTGTGIGFYVWGAMVEVGDYATSYIPTLYGTTVTRLAETCNNATQSFPSEGVLYAEIADLDKFIDSQISIAINDGTTSNRVLLYRGAGGLDWGAQVRTSGATIFNASVNYTEQKLLEFKKLAIRYKDNDFSVWSNGVLVASGTSGSAPNGLSKLSFDAATSLSSPFYGKTKMVATFPYLSNDEMECLTGEGYGTFEALAAAYSYTIK